MEKIRDRAWSVQVPFGRAEAFTLTYVFGEAAGVHVVDPGADTSSNRRLLQAAVQETSPRRPRVLSVTATHLHPDHLGLAQWLCDLHSAPLQIHRMEAADLKNGTALARYTASIEHLAASWRVPEQERSRLEPAESHAHSRLSATVRQLDDGDLLDVGDRSLRVLHTPGHTRGHVALVSADDRLVLTGDHLMPSVFPGIGLGGAGEKNPIADYLESLDLVRHLDAYEAGPGHGHRFLGISGRAATTRAHVISRCAAVRAELARSPDLTVWDIASRIPWGPGFANLRGVRLRSALMQVQHYTDFVHASDRV